MTTTDNMEHLTMEDYKPKIGYKEFDSISDAATYYNAYRENIKKVLKGAYKKTKGLTFKYKQ